MARITTAGLYKVLVVDDQESGLAALARLLERDAFRVVTTTRPADVLWLIEREAVDIVISDLEMPGLNGIELISRIRDAYPEVVRIMLTGQATLAAAIAAINQGEVFRFLTKPCDPTELRRALSDATHRLEEQRRMAQARASELSREQLMLELEREHPGITSVPGKGQTYVVDMSPVTLVLRRFDLESA